MRKKKRENAVEIRLIDPINIYKIYGRDLDDALKIFIPFIEEKYQNDLRELLKDKKKRRKK